MSNVAIWLRAFSAMRSLIEPHAAREVMLLAEDEILGDRIVEDQPRAWRSSGMCDSPASPRAFTESSVMSRVPIVNRAGAHSRSPAIASSNSVCPLPSTPAMPRISPGAISNAHAVDGDEPSRALDDEIAARRSSGSAPG